MTDSDPVSLESETVRQTARQALEDLKALDIVEIDVRARASFTDTMIFASGTSTRHTGAIADAVIVAADERGRPPIGVEGADVGEWILVDLGDVVVHVMLPDVRRYYELEKLWGEELASGR